jgi:predicted DNA-binding transcriptional regulator
MVSNHFISSCFVLGSILFCSSLLDRMSRVSLTRILVYRLVMSRDANLTLGEIGVYLSLSIRSLVFSILYMFGRGASCLIFCENVWRDYTLGLFSS